MREEASVNLLKFAAPGDEPDLTLLYARVNDDTDSIKGKVVELAKRDHSEVRIYFIDKTYMVIRAFTGWENEPCLDLYEDPDLSNDWNAAWNQYQAGLLPKEEMDKFDRAQHNYAKYDKNTREREEFERLKAKFEPKKP